MKKPTNIDKFFNGECHFAIGATKIEHIKDSYLPEIAFIGRSNVGKSSLINAILNNRIAITSKTPGRTKQLNFFILNEQLSIVDMPGYGYAKVGKKEVSGWEKLSYKYFATRANLKRAFVLIDCRRGLVDKDREMMNIFDSLAVSYQFILTKVDELKNGELEKIITKLEKDSAKFPALHPQILISSSNKNIGISQIRQAIIDLATA